MYTVYVIQNPKGELYKGYTNGLEQRILYHNRAWSTWTKTRGPWQLVYSESFESKQDALRREKFFKSGKGREFLKNIIAG